jgi:opacity protein-like surface antigen
MRSESMHHKALLSIIALFLGIGQAHAQMHYSDPSPFVPRYTIEAGFSSTRGNAPPNGACQCFQTYGYSAANAITLKYWLRVNTDFQRSKANSIGPLGQNLTLTTVTAGPQVVFHGPHFETFAGVSGGFAHGSNSYFPSATGYTTSANSFAYKMGGGVDISLNHRLSVRAIDAEFLHTSFPNGVNSSQNQLTIGAGIVVKMRGRYWIPN